MSSPIDTEHWRLIAHIGWKAVKEPFSVECPECHGRGQVGGGFKSMDSASDCLRCFGRGVVTEYPDCPDKPEVPPALVEHLRAAFKSYFAAQAVQSTGRAT